MKVMALGRAGESGVWVKRVGRVICVQCRRGVVSYVEHMSCDV